MKDIMPHEVKGLTVYEVLLEKGLIRENSFPRQAEELAEAMDL